MHAASQYLKNIPKSEQGRLNRVNKKILTKAGAKFTTKKASGKSLAYVRTYNKAIAHGFSARTARRHGAKSHSSAYPGK